MDYLTNLIAKWMPEGTNRVAVDSHPRLSGIMDTINSTLAHDPEVRLPSEFYDPKGRGFMEKISMEEWFSGYTESHEYRKVGIGSLLGDIVARMVGNLERRGNDEPFEVKDQYGDSENFKGGRKRIKFAMSGCHDTTLAAILCSLGAFENENWPPFTSHLAIELFETEPTSGTLDGGECSNPWESVFSTFSKRSLSSTSIARKRLDELTPSEAAKMKGSYVRIRYNDQPVYIPGCKPPGKHFEDDQSFCTLVCRYTDKNLIR